MRDFAYDVVVPTLGRPSLRRLLESLAAAEGPLPEHVFVVDDRRQRPQPLELGDLGTLASRTTVLAGAAAGPAAARNRGWVRSRTPWVAFLDDDVVVEHAWRGRLLDDLVDCRAAGSQGRVSVPLPHGRRATDWERNVRGLEDARWITADCAYRLETLRRLNGFDERFPRAYREDAEFAIRVLASGATIARGRRRITHPVRPAGPWISVRLQAGNADDALMHALHGPRWYERAGASRGRFRSHVATVSCAVAATAFAVAWATSTARFAWERIAPGPHDAREIATMLATSVAIPFAAVYHRARGSVRVAATLARPQRRAEAVLFDRDGTLVYDAPSAAYPEDLTLVPDAREALDRLRASGIAVGIVTNQPRVGEGTLPAVQLTGMHARLNELAGPFATVETCTHPRDAGCSCRKPQPGLIRRAAARLGLEPRDCVVVGDIGSDIAAATAAGARAILVPTPITRFDEIATAPFVARTLTQAVDLILSGAV